MKIKNTTTPVLVMDVGNHGCLGIVRSLGRLGVPIFAAHATPQTPASYSKFLRAGFFWDTAPGHEEESIARLLDIGRKIGQRCILVPTRDTTAIFAASHYRILKKWFIYLQQSPALVRSLCSKKEMFFLTKEMGISTPHAAFPQSRAEVEALSRKTNFPVVLKGIDGGRLKKHTGKTLAVASTPGELLSLYDRMEEPENPNLMLQEYIPGGDDTVWMFNGYFNEQSVCLAGFTGKKVRQSPVHAGITCLGICLNNPTVEQTTKNLMKMLGYKGMLDIGYRYDSRDGQYKVLDINPRIGATFRLFVDQDGLDVARAMYLDLTDQPVPPATPREGRKWIVEFSDLKSSMDYHRGHKLTIRQWFNSLKGIQEAGYFAMDDLLPFWRVCLKLLIRRFKRLSGARTSASAKSRTQPSTSHGVATRSHRAM